MPGKMDHRQFIALLRERFPRVAAEIDDCSAGLLHLEVATLCRATINAIREGDRETVKAHFAFVDEVFRSASPAVENALNVSYFEHIDFDGRKAKAMGARELLTPRLRRAVRELEDYWEALERRAKAE